MPLLLDRHPDLIATVPLPSFALRQHWHPRFHQDPAIIWLRELVKDTFDGYPWDGARGKRHGA